MKKHIRTLGFIEGISLLLLLFVAMPLKYGFNLPEAVRVVGMAHGLLFILYVAGLVALAGKHGRKYSRLVFAVFAATVPFGPFIWDKKIFRE